MITHCTPSLFSWGDASIAWIAAHRIDALTPFFAFITDFGSTGYILFTIALMSWFYDRRKSQYITYAMFFAVLLNLAIKSYVQECRPMASYWLQIVHSTSFPSGHAQMIVTVWWGLAYYFRHYLLSSICFLVGLSVILSRPYLGVHYPHDVFFGALFGVLVLAFFIYLEKSPSRLLSALSIKSRAALLLIFACVYLWLINDPEDNSIITLSALFGFWLGYQWQPKQDKRPLGNQMLLSIIGLFGILCFWQGIPYLFTLLGMHSPLIKVIVFALLGNWIAFGAIIITDYAYANLKRRFA